SEDRIVKEANTFIDALTSDQKELALMEFENDGRTKWHFLPLASYDRMGISLAELNDEQDVKLFNLLQASLSAEGYEKTQNIIELENVLKMIEENPTTRDPEQYHIAFYGKPVTKGTWGYSFQGHHVVLHYTFVDGKLSGAPTFLGANPAEVPSGKMKGLRVLKDEEDLGIKLVNALTKEQQKVALITEEAPREIYTANASKVEPLEEVGVSYAEMSKENQKLLDLLISEYVSVMPEDVGRKRVEKLTSAGIEKIRFAWAGPMDRSAGHYYRIQGPTFLVEFDNTQNNANHIHSVWRDFNGDFGRDLIQEHYHSADGKHGHD
ncbi:MAG: DUF3500 domain-containing protein, partial [Saprospiraceae bacterium]|nr:DUF3500 domain-containing protein [Saprospiraceae bacterium]